MWLGSSSIRPVPAYARLGQAALDQVREELLLLSEESEDSLDEAFSGFERQQPAVYGLVSEILEGPVGETTQALGYFVSLAIWLAFEQRHGRALKEVSQSELAATAELLDFDAELRDQQQTPNLATDDIVFIQQPDIMQFVVEQIESTMESAGTEIAEQELKSIYRMLLIEVLSLSYAVEAPAGFPLSRSEVQA